MFLLLGIVARPTCSKQQFRDALQEVIAACDLSLPPARGAGYDLSPFMQVVQKRRQQLLPQFYQVLAHHGFSYQTWEFEQDEDFDLAALKSDLIGYGKFLELFFNAEDTKRMDIAAVRTVLVEHPIVKDMSGHSGSTLLYISARFNYNDVLRYLLDELGCDVDAPSVAHGSTALHGACYNGNLEGVKMLLQHNANVLVRNLQGETPYDNTTYAKPANVRDEIRSLLQTHMARLGANQEWQYQENVEWVGFERKIAQVLIADQFNQQNPSVLISQGDACTVDLVNFVRMSPKGVGSDIRCCSLNLPRDREIVFEIQPLADMKWRIVTAESNKTLREAFARKAASCVLDKEITGLRMEVHLIDPTKPFSVLLEGQAYGSFRWRTVVKPTAEVTQGVLDDNDVVEEQSSQRIPLRHRVTPLDVVILRIPFAPPVPDVVKAASFFEGLPVTLDADLTPNNSALVLHVHAAYSTDPALKQIVDMRSSALVQAYTQFGPMLQPQVMSYMGAGARGSWMGGADGNNGAYPGLQSSSAMRTPPAVVERIKEDLELPPNALLRDFLLSGDHIDDFVLKRLPTEGFRSSLRKKGDQLYVLPVIGTREQINLAKSVIVRLNYFVCECESLKKAFANDVGHSCRSAVALMSKQFDCQLVREGTKLLAACNHFLQKFERQCVEVSVSHSARMNKVLQEFLLNDFLAMVVEEPDQDKLVKALTKRYADIRAECQRESNEASFEHTALQDTWSFIRKDMKIDDPSSRMVLEKHLLQLAERVPKARCVTKWRELPEIIAAGLLQAEACCLNLPLYKNSRELLDLIRDNDVVAVHTGTGTGKSTLLPPLLVAEQSYARIAVTQPRRLPCRNVCQRVLTTFSQKLAGWAVSGDSFHADRPILYLTDGLLREWLQSSLQLGEDDDNQKFDFDVIILDEVHERGWNTDICIALLAKLLLRRKEAKKPLKVILASATLDEDITKPFLSPTLKGKLKFKSFSFTLSSPFSVVSCNRKGMNPVELALELFCKKQREDQILVFLPSVAEVREAVALFDELSHAKSHGLYANQDPQAQRDYIVNGSVFFSTTIAETSLTFPRLKYVVDTGEINTLDFDHERRLSKLVTVVATESTILQRRGRLGRTCEGEYFSVYDDVASRPKYPKAQLLNLDLADVEFSLRQRASSLQEFLPLLPTPPAAAALDSALLFLKTLKLCDASGNVAPEIKQLPTLGGARITASVYAGLKEGCGCDMVYLAAILLAMPSDPSYFLKSIPPKFRSESDGDVMMLLNVMYELMRHKKQAVQEFAVEPFARSVGFGDAAMSVLRRALQKVTKIETRMERIPSLKVAAQQCKRDWAPVCRALLAGYSSNIFCSQHILQGNKALYTAFGLEQNGREQVGLLNFDSCISRKQQDDPVPWILALQVFFTPAQPDNLVLSMAGRLDPDWATHTIVRHVSFTADESSLFSEFMGQHGSLCQVLSTSSALKFQGTVREIAEKQKILHQKLVHKETVTIKEDSSNAHLVANIADLKKCAFIFHTLIWRYKNENQLDIKMDIRNDCIEFTITGRKKDCIEVRKGLNSFSTFLRETTKVTLFDSGQYPMRVALEDPILERLRMVTDSKRTKVDLWRMVKGATATRETRMAAVAWVAVCDFDCRLEGGFVRDWIVRGETQHPATPPSSWIKWNAMMQRWDVEKEVIPSDLDMELPFKYVVLDRFRQRLHKLGFVTEVQRFHQGYNLVVDRDAPTGPFTLDLIYPHNVATHDRVDFDVNNLYCLKDFSHEFGFRIDISSELSLTNVLDNIKAKRFNVMRTEDGIGIMNERVEKMKSRGWTEVARIPWIPNRGPKSGASYAPIAPNDPLYKKIAALFHSTLPTKTITCMKIISTFNMDAIYKALQAQIELENGGNANEMLLFHATKSADNVQSIMDRGFDDRYWNIKGLYGAGAYFADLASKSHDYTQTNGSDPHRYMFWCKVLLGNVQVVTAHQPNRTAPDIPYHSLRADYPGRPKEYIVYRYGQVKPYVLIQYTD